VNADLSNQMKHQIILLKKHAVVSLIRRCHVTTNHSGKEAMLACLLLAGAYPAISVRQLLLVVSELLVVTVSRLYIRLLV